jgi:hypothetical protein
MRPAGRQHSVTIPITPVRTSSDSHCSHAPTPLAPAPFHTRDAVSERDPIESESSVEISVSRLDINSDREVILSIAGFESPHVAEPDERTERQRHLAVAIRQRIESRLGGRVHDLAIRVRGETIVLEGRCATFYTKQLAQHAALGVLEDEQLENAIIVTM